MEYPIIQFSTAAAPFSSAEGVFFCLLNKICMNKIRRTTIMAREKENRTINAPFYICRVEIRLRL